MHTACTPSSHGTLSSKVLLWDDESPEFELAVSAANSMFGCFCVFHHCKYQQLFQADMQGKVILVKINGTEKKLTLEIRRATMQLV